MAIRRGTTVKEQMNEETIRERSAKSLSGNGFLAKLGPGLITGASRPTFEKTIRARSFISS
jgi:hypothetical protein